jgi:2-polyprenyl-3-methyl-5-hydroxy-6-metoxy-1,4-benzoquinol methylase
MTTARTHSGPGEEYYQQNYRSYDRQNPEPKLAYYRGQIARHRDAALPMRLHDIGCGPGNFLNSLDRQWSIFGSDINTFAVERSRQRMPHGRFVVGAGALEVLFDEQFSVITAFDVLEHVPSLEAAGPAIARQLLPGGIFIFVVPVYDGLSGPIITMLDGDPTHVHKEPRAFWLAWAAQHFEVLSWDGILRYLLPGGHYLHLVTSVGRRHTPAVLVACRARTSSPRTA